MRTFWLPSQDDYSSDIFAGKLRAFACGNAVSGASRPLLDIRFGSLKEEVHPVCLALPIVATL